MQICTACTDLQEFRLWVEKVQFDLVYRWLDFERVRRQVLDSTRKRARLSDIDTCRFRKDPVGSPSNVKADHANIDQSRY